MGYVRVGDELASGASKNWSAAHEGAMIAIRQAHAGDVSLMHGLQMMAFAEEGRRCGRSDIPPLTEDVVDIASHVAEHVALIAEQDGRVVGCVRGLVGDDACTIRALVVHPECQGQGIGSRLLRAIEAALPPAARIELVTNTVMESNVAFYERHGYRVTQRTTAWPGVVLAHMCKHASGSALKRD